MAGLVDTGIQFFGEGELIDGLSDSDLRVFAIFVGGVLGGGISTLGVFGYVATFAPPSMEWMKAVGTVLAGGAAGCLAGGIAGAAYAARLIERRGSAGRG